MPIDMEALEAMYGPMKEKTLQQAINGALAMYGWLVYHTFDSRRSHPGFPDIVAVRGDRILFAELKTQKGRLSPAQVKWMDALAKAGHTVYLWRPYDWGSGKVEEVIR